MAAADTGILSDIFNGDGIGVMGGDVLDAFLDIAVICAALLCLVGVFHKECQCRVELSCHLHGIFEIISADSIDV